VQTKKLTTGQTARRLGISTQRIHQLAASGRLAFEETPLGRLFLLEDVDQYQRLRQVRLRQRAKPRKPASG
jgi:excisionase family DNA binding protein